TGNEGKTEQEFIDSLKGDTGATGAAGAAGQDGADGVNGLSAYEVWLTQTGNEGKTEQEFIDSLKGDTGATGAAGADGQDGADGVNGLSAYEVWINEGNTGTEQDFIDSLKGDKGDKGDDGQSVTVTPGTGPNEPAVIISDGTNDYPIYHGVPGTDGVNGTPGTSAYGIWRQLGNTGTEQDFIDSLKGADGTDGIGGKTTAGTGITITGDGTEASPYVVNADPSGITLSGDVTGAANANKLTTLKGKPVDQAAPTTDGQALVYNGTEWVAGTPNVDVTNVLNAKNLTAADGTEATIEVVSGGTKAVLVETSLKVKDESITSAKIQNGTIAPIDMANGGVDKVLVTDASGNPQWADKSALEVTADNGLTKTDNNVQLGGTLIKATTITTTATQTLAIAGLDKTKVQNQQTQHLLAVDANGDIIKGLKAAMPKFFYMPSIIIPTSEEQLNAVGSGSGPGENDTFDDGTLLGSIDLYQRYVTQFGSPKASNTNKNTELPVLPAGELDYYITWYDTTVFKTVSVDNLGVLSYELHQSADVTVGSFMNIVFAVRND
ncbi:hypothetical protein VSO92_14145, partial [Myroides pelagicus]|uniref:hypothetical protein n=1 Tax=Myroides pelagicus TaxID=270914 RepID=UPI002DB94A76